MMECPRCNGNRKYLQVTESDEVGYLECDLCNGVGELPKQWVTNEGIIIAIEKMDTDHLKNCIKMIDNGYFGKDKTPLNPSFKTAKEDLQKELNNRVS